MKISLTLSLYFARVYGLHFIALLVGLMGLIYFFDTLELLRRASKYDDVPFILVLQMGLFKLPEVTQVIFPFAVLFSGLYTFWHMTQKLELIIVRASGFSAMQFLTPILAVAILIGTLQMSVLNPLGAIMVGHYERMENTYLKRKQNDIVLFEDGLWMRQDLEDGYAIIHSDSIQYPGWNLLDVTGFFFDPDHSLIMRLDAPQGALEDKRWVFKGATLHRGVDQPTERSDFTLSTPLTPQEVEDSFASAESISFWALPSHIKVLTKSGFNPGKLKVHYQVLLAQPLMYAAMILLAAGVSMHLPRSGSGIMFVMAGIFSGLAIFFFSSFMQALGTSQQVPVFLAAWSPPLLCFLCGISLVLHVEEG